MNFLNQKEDVYDIQLTSHGKYHLLNGTFTPEYYAFFDDEIIYKYKEEEQSEVKDRILEKTPIFKETINTITKQKIL